MYEKIDKKPKPEKVPRNFAWTMDVFFVQELMEVQTGNKHSPGWHPARILEREDLPTPEEKYFRQCMLM